MTVMMTIVMGYDDDDDGDESNVKCWRENVGNDRYILDDDDEDEEEYRKNDGEKMWNEGNNDDGEAIDGNEETIVT